MNRDDHLSGAAKGSTDFCSACGKLVAHGTTGSITSWLSNGHICQCAGARTEKVEEKVSSEEVIGRRYKILALIGSGGMADVYRAEDLKSHKVVALKKLKTESVPRSLWKRFEEEAKAACRFHHPNLVTVLDFGRIDGRHPYMAMDFVDGQSLAEVIARHGSVPLDQSIEIFLQVCDGLAYAHAHGIVHRDLKPSNIMLSAGTDDAVVCVKLVDFGIAKLKADGSESLALTRTGDVFGSPLYMSPEQCMGQSIDQRSDLYSLGCTIFETLTGAPPFVANTALLTIQKHQSDKPLTLRESSMGRVFPESMEKVVARLLSKEPQTRYQTALALKEDLIAVKELRAVSSAEKLKVSAPRSGKKWTFSLNTLELGLAACGLMVLGALGALLLFKTQVSFDTKQPYKISDGVNVSSVFVDPDKALATSKNLAAVEPTILPPVDEFDKAVEGTLGVGKSGRPLKVQIETRLSRLSRRLVAPVPEDLILPAEYPNLDALVKTREFDLAAKSLTGFIEDGYKTVFMYRNRGFIYALKGDYARAFEDFSKCLELDPIDSVTRFNRMLAAKRLEKMDVYEADRQYLQRLGVDQSVANAYQKAHALIEVSNNGRALELLNKISARLPADPYANRLMAEVFSRMGSSDSWKQFSLAIEKSPRTAFLYSLRAKEAEGESKVLPDLEKAYQLQPTEARLLDVTDYLHLELHSSQRALKTLQDRASNQNNDGLRCARIRYLVGCDRYSQALRELDAWPKARLKEKDKGILKSVRSLISTLEQTGKSESLRTGQPKG